MSQQVPSSRVRSGLAHVGLAIAVLLTLAGCGGDARPNDGSPATPAGAMSLIEHGLATGDGLRVCSLMYGEPQERLQRKMAASSCVAAVAKLHHRLSASQRAALTGAERSTIQNSSGSAAVSGGPADAVAAILGVKTPLVLSPFEDDWMLQLSAEEPAVKASVTR